MIDETRARFLSSIAAQIDVERVAEVHLFPAIRQGGMESGVAVLALDLKREPLPTSEQPVEGDAAPVLGEAVVESEPALTETVAADAEGAAVDAAGEAGAAPTADADDSGPYADSDETVRAEALEANEDSVVDADDDLASDLAADLAEDDDDEPVAPRRALRRYTVYTARYRHTLKGPDRGKWKVSVTEEADAPLLTVDAVVRGVQRRSGDLDEIVRLSGEEMSALTAAAVPIT